MNGSSVLPVGRFVQPQTAVTHFHIREGDVVCDFGAGSGYFTEVLAQKVGASGRVYACEIQKDLVEKIGALARSKGLFMVNPIWCDLEMDHGVKIADSTLDVGIMVNTLFQLENKTTGLHEVHRTLRSGGKFFVIDWSDSFGGLGPQPGQVISSEEARTLIESCGFVFERSFDAGDHHYGLAFRKV
jgi:predicted methyltransferase